jgi:hypothetical protein
MRKSSFSKFTHNTEGSIAILSGFIMLAMVGAVGLGTDTYLAQSTESALKHVVDLSCNRTEDTDIAVAPNVSSVNVLTKTFANNLKSGTAAKDAVISISDPVDGTLISEPSTISATATVTPTFTAVLGAKPFNVTKSATCSRRPTVAETPITPTPNPTCNVVLTYLDTTRKNSIAVNDLSQFATIEKVGGTNVINYIYTVVDKDKNITMRKFFSNDINVDPKDLKNNGKDQTMYVQVMNADGSIPNLEKQCVTQSQVTIPPVVTNPPPVTPKCTQIDGIKATIPYAAEDMHGDQAGGEFKTTTLGDYTITPALNDIISGVTSVITVKHKTNGNTLLVPITSNFYRLDKSNPVIAAQYASATALMGGIDPESAFLIGMLAHVDGAPNDFDGAYNYHAVSERIANNYRLDTIVSGATGSWQAPGDTSGHCAASLSPIVIDLTNKGSIATTGASTAQKAVRASIGKTINFDMLGNGNPQKMEWIVGNGQGFLVDNRDGNAAKDMSGKRLFGNTAQHANGYSKLAVMFPPDKDGILTGDSLKGLGVWVDNGDGIVQSGEIKSLSELGITEISTRMESDKDNNGDMLMRSYVIRNNIKILSEDVWFGVGK